MRIESAETTGFVKSLISSHNDVTAFCTRSAVACRAHWNRLLVARIKKTGTGAKPAKHLPGENA
jgi:hypothetical protein